jgi:alpha-L-rhamnosidase
MGGGLLFGAGLLSAQQMTINQDLLTGAWPASWITCPDAPQRDYGVYHFRKTFLLATGREHFIIHVSADNRYRLFVNGQPVCSGPARGDLYNWYYETVDVGPYLHAGQNTLAAEVWNMGVYAPVAQVSNRTAFVLEGGGESEMEVGSNSSWKVLRDSAYSPCSTDNGTRLGAYMVTGPGDRVDGSNYPWGWEQPGYDDRVWRQAEEIGYAQPAGHGTDNLWTLVPRNIPLMEERKQRIPAARRVEWLPTDNEQSVGLFLQGNHPLHIPANRKVSLLLDQTYNTVAYPELIVSGGKNASIQLSYAEALQRFGQKNNRNYIEGKELIGNYDVFQPDGGAHRLFRPLWFRTYRYLQVDITTQGEPLDIEDFYGMYTGYPFERQASFMSNDTSLQEIWNVSWRTARLCAGETYFDCPYYEQLQYEADTRIQSLISLYVAGDDRLMRKAILDFYHSRVPEGLTQGRYPSNRLQVIPPFSLFWISMVYDYWMHRKDDAFVSSFLTAIRGVLDWYALYIDHGKGMLGPMPWWNFVDWADKFKAGVPDGANYGHSSIITLKYAYTLRQASRLFDSYGRHYEAQGYARLADSLSRDTYRLCFDPRKGEMANTPEKTTFSQHAGIMAILAGAIPPGEEKGVMHKLLYDNTLEQGTFYYRFYLTQAMKQVGMADLYYSQLTPWRNMLALGLTTFAEKPDPTRSDCHAWSASPDYDFLATICGIMPDAPGFGSVLIKPALGELQEVRAAMPHPQGMIAVHLKKTNGGKGLEGEVTLPEKLTGRFVYAGKVIALHGGTQTIKL